MNSVIQKMNSRLGRTGLPIWYVFIVLATCLSFAISQSFIALVPPFLIAGVVVLLRDIRRVYWALFFCIPLSTEVYLGFGLGTDLPTEQFMWMLTGIGVLLFLLYHKRISGIYMTHPLVVIVLLLLSWLFVTSVTSEIPLHSFKYLLARTWYVVSLFFMTLYIVRSSNDVRKVLTILFTTLFFTVIIVLIRHSFEGFAFDKVNSVLNPFYRNHVNYACLLAICTPFFYWLAFHAGFNKYRYTRIALFALLLIALYLTYTRAAILATAILPVFYFIIKRKLLMHATIVALLVVGVVVGNLVKEYNYLAYAPNFERTITHGNFEDVLSATYKLEDISTMERVYRWVAGYRMVVDKPVFGFGPANFYETYRPYTVTAFKTYVSDNPEKSGIHNYYLMLLVEQGFPGLLIFIAFVLLAFYYGQSAYVGLRDPIERSLILAALGSVLITLTISIMNDMLETDKVGTIFLFSMALILRGHIQLLKQRQSDQRQIDAQI